MIKVQEKNSMIGKTIHKATKIYTVEQDNLKKHEFEFLKIQDNNNSFSPILKSECCISNSSNFSIIVHSKAVTILQIRGCIELLLK